MTGLEEVRGNSLLISLEVGEERARQHEKWGEQNHPDGTGGDRILRHTDINLDLRTSEELSRIFRRRCEEKFAAGEGTYLDILLEEVFEAAAESDPKKLRAELIQCAAVCIAWVEAIDRRAENVLASTQRKEST